ncbi:eukaryotic translation initiation factor 2D [Anthonomus grandis grandis]|uniref:eukaryotic translation initiation factor 2D n=1 Tax=Anthonomus grandis grandis TaxID=2921223 RepID=UPI002165DDF9|nr:eukaryotic translation initiation factor 2D [Anthonomus grandis grandis]
MFKKPVRIKSNNQVKGSERKGVKDLFTKTFPNAIESEVNSIFNNKKEALNCLKLVTHDEEVLQVYTMQKQPLFFTVREKLLPTVFLLWKMPNLVPSFTTHPQVMTFINSGADLMLPGVVTPPPHTNLPKYGNVSAGDVVYVNLSDNKAAVAVGVANQSSFDMERSGGKGKGVIIYHYLGDHLCQVDGAGKTPKPNLGPPEWLSLKSYDLDFPALGEKPIEVITDPIEENNESKEEIIKQEEVVPEDNSTDSDELLHYCFLASIKYSKSLTLPVLISNFFKLQMLPMCPEGSTLDIKKTSYKKLKPFLDEMAGTGLITIKEIKKGVEAITDINKTHPKFNEFYLKPEYRPKSDKEEVKKTTVTESYIITANVLPLFQAAGYHKGDIIDGPNIRKYVTEHVKQHNCQVENNVQLVQPSTEVLKKVCKTDNPVSWEEIFEKVCEAMKSCFKVNAGNDQILNKGKVSPIIMSVSVRSGNKKVTIIDNLEVFGININEFAKECQHGVAASTSITPTPPGKKCDQLLVQGNQVVFVHNLLTDKYKIPKKYIRGLELAPKKRK